MTGKDKSKAKKKGLTLESVIIVGLSLKLIMTLTFLLLSQTSVGISLPVQPAYAQEEGVAEPDQEKEEEVKDTQPAPSTAGQMAFEAREIALKRKEERLREREAALDALEKELNKRMIEIEATRKKLVELVEKQEALLEEQRLIKDARIEHLVTAYKGMRPEKAGKLVDSLEDDVAVKILSAMPGRAAGQILAFVDPEKAARLTKRISLRKNANESSPEKNAGNKKENEPTGLGEPLTPPAQ